MTARHWTSGIFLLACLAQLAFASSALWQGESVLQGGSLYRFVTDPVDPVDPFRGRYVAFTFRPVRVPLEGDAEIAVGGTAYVELGVDAEGYGTLLRAHAEPIAADHLALPVIRADRSGVTVRLPFERYYAREERALEIDRQRWVAGGRFVLRVRVKDGRGVIESLELGEMPAPLSLEDIGRPDPGEPLPDGLLEALRAALPVREARQCRSQHSCLLFEVELDRDPRREFVYHDSAGGMLYCTEGPRGWHVTGRLYLRRGRPLPADRLLAELRSGGAHAADPPIRDLRVGDKTWRVQY